MQQYGSIVTNELSTAMSSAVTAVVNGTGTVQEAFATMFQNIGRAFLDMATRMIAQALVMKVLGILMPGSGATAAADPLANFNAGALQYRANGGPVTSGSPYIVGERGPELFVPGRSGTIVPNESMGGGSSTNVVVNVDASGSKVEGNDQQGNQLGRVIAAAVQQELIKQKRPGGLLV
jgi:phage-related minor tail protein